MFVRVMMFGGVTQILLVDAKILRNRAPPNSIRRRMARLSSKIHPSSPQLNPLRVGNLSSRDDWRLHDT